MPIHLWERHLLEIFPPDVQLDSPSKVARKYLLFLEPLKGEYQTICLPRLWRLFQAQNAPQSAS